MSRDGGRFDAASEAEVTRAIGRSRAEEFVAGTESEGIVVGGGPSG
jgi:thiamine thiazole synthase